MVNYSNLSLPNALETFCLLLSLDSLVVPTNSSDTVGRDVVELAPWISLKFDCS